VQIRKRQLAISAILIAVSIFALQPGIILAAPNQQGTMSINASGQAFPVGNGNEHGEGKNKGSQSSATLTLTGNARMDGNQLKLTGLSGLLQIGSTNYALSGGQGEGNDHGKLEIQTKSSGGEEGVELVLHGNMEGDNVFFTNPQSKLASLYFLSLSGQITLNVNTVNILSNTSRSGRTSDSEDEGQTVTVTQNKTITQDNTVTDTVTQNMTETVTELQNQTLTITEPVNITVTETIIEPENVTITVTQTGTSSTITQTITTVSNSTTTETTTVTQNVTVTVP
jgi:hypothetical protein